MKPLNVMVDFHHASLLNSFILLFENRLGGNVYRPIGLEWAEKGFWNIYDHPATRAQFLTMDQGYRPVDGTAPLNNIGQVQDNVYYCQDIDSGSYNKAITLDTFFDMDIDIIIATIPQHVEPFNRLSALHKNHPKVIYQIGNSWNVPFDTPVKNIMASARLPFKPEGFNIVEYHQEFDTKIFRPENYVMQFGVIENGVDKKIGDEIPIGPANNIYSFVNCFNVDGLFALDWQLFEKVEGLMPDWKFRAYGGQCRDGAAHGSQELADRMRESRFIWHTKCGGDGYGHVLHNSAAVGRPLIARRQYYTDKMGGDLMIDGVTAILIDGLNPEEIIQKIVYYNDPVRYYDMCQAVYKNFCKNVMFEKEAEDIKLFLSKLL